MHIVYYPDPVLLKPADRIDHLPDNLDEIIAGMRAVMELERGIGLAAPQVGLSRRLILVNETGSPADEKILINPEITRTFGKREWGEEGCLSFPDIWGEVLRWKNVEVSYSDRLGQAQKLEARDLTARVLQHEIDHLNGVLFYTLMRPGDQHSNKKKLEDLRERFRRRQDMFQGS